jgi:hypothetical protein
MLRSETETPEVVRIKTYLAGNLDSVAIEMSHRYRGRNKSLTLLSLSPSLVLSLLAWTNLIAGDLLSTLCFVALLQSAQD